MMQKKYISWHFEDRNCAPKGIRMEKVIMTIANEYSAEEIRIGESVDDFSESHAN